MASEITRSHPRRSGFLVGFTMALTITAAFFGLANNIFGIFGFTMIRLETRTQLEKRAETAEATLAKANEEMDALKQKIASAEASQAQPGNDAALLAKAKEEINALKQEIERLKNQPIVSAQQPESNPSAQSAQQGGAVQENLTPEQEKYNEWREGAFALLREENYEGRRFSIMHRQLQYIGTELEFQDMLQLLNYQEVDSRFRALQLLLRKLKTPLDRPQLSELEKMNWGNDASDFKAFAQDQKMGFHH